MVRRRMKGTKYNRITRQQKYTFLKLVINQNQSIQEAAHNSGMQYSTAKTILFFHKNNYKNYDNYFVEGRDRKKMVTAALKAIELDADGYSLRKNKIEIIVNSGKKKQHCKIQPSLSESYIQQDKNAGLEMDIVGSAAKRQRQQEEAQIKQREGVNLNENITNNLLREESDIEYKFCILKEQ